MHARTISLDEYEISTDPEVRQFLTDQYLPSYYQDIDAVQEYIDRFLESLKQAPKTSMFRINFCLASDAEKVMEDLRCHFKQNWKEGSVHLRVSDHFSDVIEIHVHGYDVTSIHTSDAVATMTATSDANLQLSHCTVPEPSQSYPILFSHWPRRRQFGWPMTHRIVLCDRFCAEAVLRGSHVFIPGILCTDNAIETGETVAVYGYMGRDSSKPTRGGTLAQQEVKGLCLFLGLGLAHENREQLVAPNGRGLGVYMTLSRAGTILPPLDRLGNLGMLQNLPSIAVAHALDAQPGHIILDMCSAPGGKTTHLASLTRGKSFIIACDKSQSKVHKMKQLVESMGATHCISVIPLDTTKCIDDDHDNGTCVLDVSLTCKILAT
jgi:16S rRNA methyltransferase RsmB/F